MSQSTRTNPPPAAPPPAPPVTTPPPAGPTDELAAAHAEIAALRAQLADHAAQDRAVVAAVTPLIVAPDPTRPRLVTRRTQAGHLYSVLAAEAGDESDRA